MTIVRNPKTKVYEADIKDRMAGRLHVSLRTTVLRVAQPRHDAVEAFMRERPDLVPLLRERKLRVEAVEVCRREKREWSTLLPEVDPWPTVRELAAHYVAALRANENKSDSTADTAASQLALFLAFVPVEGEAPLGDRRADRVTSADVEAYQQSIAGKKTNTRTAYVGRVGSLYRWAIRREAQRARDAGRTPRALHVPIDPETQPRGHTARERWLTQDEANALLRLTPDRLLAPVALGLFAGLRVSEMLHLQPPPFDIDWDAGTIAIREKRVAGVHWKPKTKRSARKVRIASALRPILERHAERYASPTWLVPAMTNPLRPLNGFTLDTHFQRVVVAAGMTPGRATTEGVTFHTLRHTCASHMVRRGIDLYRVAKILGDTVQVIEDTYSHLAPDHSLAAMEQLAGVFTVPDRGED